MKRVIITGATGFVGANLARRLLLDGHEVHLLVRGGASLWRVAAIRHDVRWHEVDLGDSDTLARVVARIGADWVFHLAAHGAYSTQADLHKMIATNLIATVNLVEACRQVGFEAFVHAGSSSEYGYKDHAPDEHEWIDPNSDYAVTKAAATLFCRYTAQRHCLHLVTLRLYSIYGPYEEPTRLMPTLIVRGLEGRLPPLVRPDMARDYVYIDDANEALVRAASSAGQEPGAVYNVGTGVQTALREVVEMTRRALAIQTEPVWGSMADRHWDTNVWVANSGKLQRTLGWRPLYTIEQGFGSMIQWFSDHPELLALYRARLGAVN
ncbi:MAG: NAD-dependent epimerase/dehydratase family protein [Ktedonobacterales bacterium]